jgi:hypothetical protein
VLRTRTAALATLFNASTIMPTLLYSGHGAALRVRLPPVRGTCVGGASPSVREMEFRAGGGGFRLEVRQDGRLLAVSRPGRLIPGRPVHLNAGWLGRVDPGGGPMTVRIRS